MAQYHCFYCDEPAYKLCDGKVGEGTCDRPLCNTHAHETFAAFVCAVPRSRSRLETIDYCQDCMEKRLEKVKV